MSLKVLMFGWEFPPNISGGLGVACYGIVQSLLDHPIELTLILPDMPIPAAMVDRDNLKIIYSSLDHSFFGPYSAVAKSVLFNQGMLSAVEEYANVTGQFAQTIPHDVIHAHDWLTVLAAINAKNISHKPLIFHVHSLEIDRCAEPLNKMIYDIEKYGLEQADCIIAVSEFTRQRIIQYYNIPPDKIAVVHNGIFKKKLQKKITLDTPLPGYKTVLFLGRMTYQKGPFYFIEAAHSILKHRQDVQFVMAGTGDLLHSAIERVAELGLGTHVHFTHFLSSAQVDRLYQKCHVYVMPSIAEPFGLTCLEALAQDIPVVLSKQSGAAEVMQHTLKIDFWDVKDSASKIMALLDYPILKKQLLENNSCEVRKLLWCETAKKLMGIYMKTTANGVN